MNLHWNWKKIYRLVECRLSLNCLWFLFDNDKVHKACKCDQSAYDVRFFIMMAPDPTYCKSPCLLCSCLVDFWFSTMFVITAFHLLFKIRLIHTYRINLNAKDNKHQVGYQRKTKGSNACHFVNWNVNKYYHDIQLRIWIICKKNKKKTVFYLF